ncbi:PatB family C-S lyase [Aquimarina sp. 2201CG5-10]|uniref:MalY/PatB family protein n=1 Tax=Aquimarina callyspongiae TaxID=3098150 RepID=UPI002AB367FD|nr:PatB family C-S lyase [Aquimarina sp. 2201CG5-10]MDY8134344.1 PatB family C-S lyase [Aquimarina sp. 2201CG5-10]
MSLFDNVLENYKHHFAKHNPQMLKHIFGSDDVMPFWIADMDFKVADPISKELKRLVDRGIYAYEFDASNVYKEIVSWNERRHQLLLDKNAFVQVTGVLTGISLAIRELTEINDGVLIQTPVYHQFAQIIKTANRKIVKNPLKMVNGAYEMDFEDLEQKLKTENVKIILLCNPHNPVGRVWKHEELEKVIKLASIYNVTIISDEIHADIIYSKHKFQSITSFSTKNQITLIGSPAKTFGMQSISNGYLYIPDESIRQQIKNEVDSMYLNHGNAFSTFATIAAFKYGDFWLDELLTYLEQTIIWIQEYLKEELSMIAMYPVEGTYQVWLDFSKFNYSKEELNDLLVDKAKLGLTPGYWFDKEYKQFARMNIASPLPKIQEAFNNLKVAIHENI